MSWIFIKFLILKEEIINLTLRFLQQRSVKVRTFCWAKLEKIRYGSLKYNVKVLSGGVSESLHGVVELLTLPRYVVITLFIKCSRNLFLFSILESFLAPRKGLIDLISSM